MQTMQIMQTMQVMQEGANSDRCQRQKQGAVSGAALRFSQAGTAPRREKRLSARGGMSWSALSPYALTVLRSAGPEGEGGCFDSPSLPPLDSLPTHSDQGGALDPKAEGRSGRLAEKALYCVSEVLRIAFSGRHPPCAPIVYARPSGAPAISSINGVKGQANEPAGCFLPLPRAGEVAQAAQADCDGEGNRQAQRKRRGFLTPPSYHRPAVWASAAF